MTTITLYNGMNTNIYVNNILLQGTKQLGPHSFTVNTGDVIRLHTTQYETWSIFTGYYYGYLTSPDTLATTANPYEFIAGTTDIDLNVGFVPTTITKLTFLGIGLVVAAGAYILLIEK